MKGAQRLSSEKDFKDFDFDFYFFTTHPNP